MMKSKTAKPGAITANTQTNPVLPVATLVPTTSVEKVENSIKSLMTAGKTQVCTYTRKDNNTTMNGKIYVADGKMRGDFTELDAKGQNPNQHIIINDNTYVYAWSDLMNRGVKMTLSAAKSASTTNGSPNLDEPVQLSCQGWTADQSFFTVPTTITFLCLWSRRGQ